MAAHTPCEHCERTLQPYLDRELSPEEIQFVEAHLDGCGFCRKGYRFEETLRGFVRKTCSESMSPELKARLAALRNPL